MLTGKKLVVLADIDSAVDSATLDKTKVVTNGRKLMCNVDLVGINTAQVGQSQGYNLAYSVEIYRQFYSKELYAFFDDTLFKIKSLSKAKLAVNMLLNVEPFDDDEIATAIKEWKDG